MNNAIEAFKIALALEKKGYKTYLDMAAKVSDKLARSTLKAIAAKELEHIKAMEGFCQLPDKKVAETKMTGVIKYSDKKDYIRKIAGEIGIKLEADLKAGPDLTPIYETAMGLERESYSFYKELHQEAVLPNVKAFFKLMMDEENTHYELLQETLQYLDRPGDWFREQERWIVEG